MDNSDEVLTGISSEALLDTAFSGAAEAAEEHPHSVFCITQEDDMEDQIMNRWKNHGKTHQIRHCTLDEVIADCYQQSTSYGAETHIHQGELYRLVELALENEIQKGNPLKGGRDFPKSGSVEHAEQLLSLVRFGGLLSPEKIRSGLTDHGLADRGRAIADLQQAFDRLRNQNLSPKVTTRAERYAEVVDEEGRMREVMEGVDVAVVTGFRRLSESDKQVLKCLREIVPTVAMHPIIADSESDLPIDRATRDVLKGFQDIGFERNPMGRNLDGGNSTGTASSTESETDRLRAMTLLYTYTGDSEEGKIEEENVSLRHMPTPTREIRHIVRDIREQVASDVDPSEISIYLPDRGRYLRTLTTTCSQYDVPLSLETSVPLTQTAVGNAVNTILELARPTATPETVVELFTNPVVDTWTEEGNGELAHVVSRVAPQVTPPNMDRLLEAMEDEHRSRLEDILEDCRSLRSEDLPDSISTVRSLLDRLDLSSSVNRISDQSDLASQLEVRALDILKTELDTIERVASEYEGNRSVERLLRVIRLSQVSGSIDGHDNSVSVRSLEEAAYDESQIVYLPGLASDYYPTSQSEIRFSKPITEADPAFDSPEPSDVADQSVAFLIASPAEVHLSYPTRSIDGDEFVIAPILREILRVTDLNDKQAGEIGPDHRPGSFEDLQREFSEFEDLTPEGDDVDEAIDEIGENEDITEEQEVSLREGVRLARNRRQPHLTEYDGVLKPEIVEGLHPKSTRHPYSPSRLERYSRCGFKYYMKTVLDFEPRDEIQEEMDNLTQGTFVHNSLERFTSKIQEGSGARSWKEGYSMQELENLLLNSALEELDDMEVSESIFDRRWLEKVLAGLGDEEDNPYYAESWSAGQPEGLFVNFLDNEEELHRRTDSRLWLAEERVGKDTYGPNPPLQDDPVYVQGNIPIHGTIDRIDIVRGSESNKKPIVVRDYKTGGTPSGEQTVEGVRFQLPVYALLAEEGLSPEHDVEAIGGAYYKVSTPDDVSDTKGTVSSSEHASHGQSGDVTPLKYWRGSVIFDSHTEFREFIEETTPRRLSQIETAVQTGIFAPTVLEPDDAGCSYCPYSEACDVRPERRLDKIDAIDDTDTPVYIPIYARESDGGDD